MGNENSRRLHGEQSVPSGAQSASQIGDSPRRLTKHQSLISHHPEPSRFRTASLKHSIVTVHGGQSSEDSFSNDATLMALQAIPTFFPIVRDSVRNPVMKEVNSNTKLDFAAASALVTKYQNVVRDSCDEVAKNQQYLTQRVRDMDSAVATVHQGLQEKSRKLAKQTDQIDKLKEVQTLMRTSEESILSLDEQLNKLNRCLPPEMRLEPLQLKNVEDGDA